MHNNFYIEYLDGALQSFVGINLTAIHSDFYGSANHSPALYVRPITASRPRGAALRRVKNRSGRFYAGLSRGFVSSMQSAASREK